MGLSALLWKSAVNLRPHFFHQTITAAEVLRFDGSMKIYRYNSRLNGKPSFWHDVMGSGDSDGNERDSGLHGEIEGALLERKELAIEGAFAFHVDRHVEALLDNGLRARTDSMPASRLPRST